MIRKVLKRQKGQKLPSLSQLTDPKGLCGMELRGHLT